MKFLQDLASLEVVTVTGDVSILKLADYTPGGGDNRIVFSFDELFSSSNGVVSLHADLKVVAASKIHIDHDTFNFVAAELNDQEKELVGLHLNSVDAALNGRANIIAKIKPSLNVVRGGNGR
ncbi:MAG: hypothetical protein AAFN92_04110 [Bacteroidota bacterium]